MSNFDAQEQAILRALIRNPRVSDNRIATTTGVPVRTVRRKRSRLENEGRVRYYAAIDRERSQDAAAVTTQHMVIIKFRLGVTREQIEEEIRNEPNVANVFSELIRDSYLAETDGHIALVMIVEGPQTATSPTACRARSCHRSRTTMGRTASRRCARCVSSG